MDNNPESEQDDPNLGVSPDELGETPPGEPETIPKTQADEMVTKAVGDALREAGRAQKDIDTRKATLDATEAAQKARGEELDDWQKDRDQAELEAARGNPEALTAAQARQQLSAERRTHAASVRKHDQNVLQHDANVKTFNETQREILIWTVATKHKADPEALKNLVTELKLETPEQMDVAAKTIAGKKPPSGKAPPGGGPDSGETTGVTEVLTAESVEKMPIASVEKALEKDAKK